MEIDHSCDDWDYAPAADHLLARIRKLRNEVSKACIISGGEVTVKVPGNRVPADATSILLFTVRENRGRKHRRAQRGD